MFYANPSIKKAQIGYRGAWAAFGVEFNFPVSHNWVSMSPVDFAYAAHADGSASVWVGNIDRVYGMQWGVELVFRARLNAAGRTGDACITAAMSGTATIGGTTRECRCGTIRTSIIRCSFIASHGFTDVYRWPIDAEGNDLSIIKNQTDGPGVVFCAWKP